MDIDSPDWESASFFSNAQVENVAPINFLELYIPANPFNALSNSYFENPSSSIQLSPGLYFEWAQGSLNL